jgi:hypothetical protein
MLVFISHTLVLAIGIKYVRRTDALVAYEFDNKSQADCVRDCDHREKKEKKRLQMGQHNAKQLGGAHGDDSKLHFQ